MAPKERGAIQIKLHINLYTYNIYYATNVHKNIVAVYYRKFFSEFTLYKII